MKTIKLLLILLLVSVAHVNAQADPKKVFRLTSNISQLYTRENIQDEFEKKDIFAKHLIVIDLNKSEITIYHQDSVMTSLSILKRVKVETTGKFSDINYACLDERNIKCDVVLCLDEEKGKPFFIRLKYPKAHFLFFFD